MWSDRRRPRPRVCAGRAPDNLRAAVEKAGSDLEPALEAGAGNA